MTCKMFRGLAATLVLALGLAAAKFLMVGLPPETTPSAIHVSLNWSASAAK